MSGRRYLKDEDFEEGDVWGAMETTEIPSPKFTRKLKESSFSSTPRLIPRGSYPNKESHKMVKQSSAPMNIPMYAMVNKKGGTSIRSYDQDLEDDDVDADAYAADDDDGDEEIVPPHEYIARRLARSQITSFSVCEGVGRTLKGRDLSKVRNAILRKTGFLE